MPMITLPKVLVFLLFRVYYSVNIFMMAKIIKNLTIYESIQRFNQIVIYKK